MADTEKPKIEWSDEDSEGYRFLRVNGDYAGYVGFGVQNGKYKTYLESRDVDGFDTVEQAQAALLAQYRRATYRPSHG